VFSQFGDDGIIQHLVGAIPSIRKSFVEFGVEDYTESNTRFLLVNDCWSGLVFDASHENVRFIQNDCISTLFDLHAIQAFVTAENINALLESAGLAGEIGLLSIDIDGMDYWVWRSVYRVEAAIVIIEYNSIFGESRSIVVPYDAQFSRRIAHPSALYWGASLGALVELGKKKGYSFVGCNSNGNNAYFVKHEYVKEPLQPLTVEEGFTSASFNEYVKDGRRIRSNEKAEVVRGLPVYNVLSREIEPF
jgi:hypothetical protein